MQNLCECVDTYVRKYMWPKLSGVAMCVCVYACEKKKMQNLCECIDTYVRKYMWPKLRGVAMCVCVHAGKNAKFNSKAISCFLRKFAPSKISRYTVALF